MGLWPVYKPSFNPIGQVAVEIQPDFQSRRSRGLVDMVESRHRVKGVMAGILIKFQGYAGHKNQVRTKFPLSSQKYSLFSERGGARGLVGVAKLYSKLSWVEVGLPAKFQLTGPSNY